MRSHVNRSSCDSIVTYLLDIYYAVWFTIIYMKEIDPIPSFRRLRKGGPVWSVILIPMGKLNQLQFPVGLLDAGRWTRKFRFTALKIWLRNLFQLVAQGVGYFIFLLVALGIKLSLHEYTVAKISSTSIK